MLCTYKIQVEPLKFYHFLCLIFQVEMLVEVGRKELKPLDFTNCFPSDRPGMILEILPKVIFETVETETGIEEVDFPKPIFRLTIDQGTIVSFHQVF